MSTQVGRTRGKNHQKYQSLHDMLVWVKMRFLVLMTTRSLKWHKKAMGEFPAHQVI